MIKPTYDNVPRPMLACSKPVVDLSTLRRFPYFVQPKLDGVRAISTDEGLFSRTGKRIPNKALQTRHKVWREQVADYTYDGELCMDKATNIQSHEYNDTQAVVMSAEDFAGCDLYYNVFDIVHSHLDCDNRQTAVSYLPPGSTFAEVVPTYLVRTLDELQNTVDAIVSTGFEGAIIRRVNGKYKIGGRSTLREELLLKVVEYVRTEATIVGATPLVRESGLTEDLLGAFIVTAPGFDGEFSVGSGFTIAQRKTYWDMIKYFNKRKIVIKYKPFGTKDAPRQPIFVGWRNEIDL